MLANAIRLIAVVSLRQSVGVGYLSDKARVFSEGCSSSLVKYFIGMSYFIRFRDVLYFSKRKPRCYLQLLRELFLCVIRFIIFQPRVGYLITAARVHHYRSAAISLPHS